MLEKLVARGLSKPTNAYNFKVFEGVPSFSGRAVLHIFARREAISHHDSHGSRGHHGVEQETYHESVGTQIWGRGQ